MDIHLLSLTFFKFPLIKFRTTFLTFLAGFPDMPSCFQYLPLPYEDASIVVVSAWKTTDFTVPKRPQDSYLLTLYLISRGTSSELDN